MTENIKAAGKHVLVVDDSPVFRTIVEAIVEGALANVDGGFSVTTAADGEDALNKLSQDRFDLVISDLQMLPMDGNALLEKMKADEKLRPIPFILMSGCESHAREAHGRDALQAGAFAFIVKLDDFGLLPNVIQAALYPNGAQVASRPPEPGRGENPDTPQP